MKNKKHGFTLIELLVVISIISLMSSIVMAAVNIARAKAQIGAGQQFSANLDHEIGANAAGWWDLNECPPETTINDKSGNNINFTLTQGITWAQGSTPQNGCSLSFDGTAGLTATAANNVITPGAPVTFAAWVRPSSISDHSTMIAAGQVNPPYQYALFINSNKFQFGTFSVSGAQSKTIPQVNTWYYVVGVFDGSKYSIYINGQLENSMSSSGISLGTTFTNHVYLGSYMSSYGFYLNGNMYNARIYSSALVAEAIQKNYLAERNSFLAKR